MKAWELIKDYESAVRELERASAKALEYSETLAHVLKHHGPILHDEWVYDLDGDDIRKSPAPKDGWKIEIGGEDSPSVTPQSRPF